MYIIYGATKILESGQIRKKAALPIPFVCVFLKGENMEEIYMSEAIEQAKKALRKGEVPVEL